MKTQYGPEEMLYPNKQLYRYNIRNGDEIIIDSKLNRFASTSSTTSSIRSWRRTTSESCDWRNPITPRILISTYSLTMRHSSMNRNNTVTDWGMIFMIAFVNTAGLKIENCYARRRGGWRANVSLRGSIWVKCIELEICRCSMLLWTANISEIIVDRWYTRNHELAKTW